MASAYSVLGQSNPSAATPTTLYTVPSSTETVISSITICNTGSAADSFRVAVRPAGASLATVHYVYFDLPIDGNDTFIATVGLTLEATDVVTIYAGGANLVFHIYGSEITA